MTIPAIETLHRKRRFWVWGIFLVFGVLVPLTLLLILSLYWLDWLGITVNTLSPKERAQAALNATQFISKSPPRILITAIDAVAAIFLFRFRAVAVPLFAAALVLSLFHNWGWWFHADWRAALLGFAISLAMLLYAVRLKRKGVLV
jgi:hypothetical protein